MSRFSGPQFKGAQKDARQTRREEAEARNARTPLARRAAVRRAIQYVHGVSVAFDRLSTETQKTVLALTEMGKRL